MDLAKLISLLMAHTNQQPQKPLPTYQQDGWDKLDVPFNGVPNGLPFNDTNYFPSLEDTMRMRAPGVMDAYKQGVGGGDYEQYKNTLLEQELRRRMLQLQLKGQM